jgi:hypothetical protein
MDIIAIAINEINSCLDDSKKTYVLENMIPHYYVSVKSQFRIPFPTSL